MRILLKDGWVRVLLTIALLLALSWASEVFTGPSDLSLFGQLFLRPFVGLIFARSAFVWLRLFRT